MLDRLLLEIIQYYERAFEKSDKAQKYIRDRGLADFYRWHFGYADGNLCGHLINKGIDVPKLVEYGLMYEDSGRDIFNDGIIIPYYSADKPLTFRFRDLDKDSHSKYKSLSSTSPIYKQSYFNIDSLFGEPDVLFVCEGEFDTITLAENGYAAIGIAGVNNIPHGYEKEIANVKNIYLCFDPDKAGDGVAITFTFRLGRTCRRLLLPTNTDINSLVSEKGPKVINELIMNSVDIDPEIFQYELDGTTSFPFAYESEVAIINLVINNPFMASKIIEELGIKTKSDDRYFYNNTHSRLFRTLLDLYYRCEPIDFANIVDAANIPKAKISEIKDMKFEVDNYKTYCNNLKKAYVSREAITRSNDIMVHANRKSSTVGSILDRVNDWQDVINKTASAESKFIAADELMDSRKRGLFTRMNNPIIGCGFKDLDKLLPMGFMVPGEISVIAGRPASGKSLFKANIIRNLCQMGVCVVNVSPEQGVDIEHDRLDALMLGKNIRDFYDRNLLKEGLYDEIVEQMHYVENNWNYYLMPSRDISFTLFRRYLEQLSKKQATGVVFVDLVDKFNEICIAGDKTRFAYDSILIGCNVLARQTGWHICLLHQIKRLGKLDRRSPGKPCLEDLKETGRFEQDTFVAYLIYRPAMYDKNKYDNEMHVILAKQRQGVCGDNVIIKLGLDKKKLYLYDIEQDEEI